ncbi:MAG: PQQ-binding-like beta-propeller repeat protein [Planctomycetota bacterium]
MMMKSCRLGLWAAVLMAGWVGLRSLSAQENWPDFRGPDGQGHASSKGLPTKWSDAENVVWRQAVPGHGWSSPVVFGGRIFVTSAVPGMNPPAAESAPAAEKPNAENPAADAANRVLSLRALAFDAASGKPVWNVEVFVQSEAKAPKIHGKNSHASPTPVVHEGRLFVHFGHQGTACLDLDGKILWRNQDLAYAPVHGNGGTPALVDGKLVFSCDGAADPFIVALDQQTGRVVWKVNRTGDAPRKFSFSTPLVIDVAGQKQIISPGSNSVSALAPADGSEIWRVKYEGYSVIPRPVYGGGLVFIGTGYDTPSVLAIRPTGTGDVTETHVAWTIKKAAPHTPSLLLVGDELYMVSDRGVATCVEARTGKEIWQERIGGNYSASPLYADGKIYFPAEGGESTVVQAGREFVTVAKNTLPERTFASYAVTGQSLIIRTEGFLYRIKP